MSTVEPRQELFRTCDTCVVRDWCKLRSGEVKLPPDYLASFCVGYEKLEKAISLAGIKKEYRNANLHNYVVDADNQNYADTLRALLANAVGFVESGTNLALINKGKGTGKTWTANAVLNEFIYKTCRDPKWFDFENPIGLYVKFGTWANKQRDAIGMNDEDLRYHAAREIQKMKEVPLLILDDIGSGRITDFIRDLTYDIVDYRKEEQKSTIFTSNSPESVLMNEDVLGEMLVTRMFYNTMVVPLGGRNRRQDHIHRY